jgi:outer membrane protein assembly factor BamB
LLGRLVNEAGGRGDLTDKAVIWRYEKGLPNIPSPLLYKNVLYLLREGGILTALNPATGEVLKQGCLQGALDPYFASPVAADDKIFTVSLNGKLAALKAGAEWEILSVGDLGEECWATPASADGRLYVRTVSAICCFGSTLVTVWRG